LAAEDDENGDFASARGARRREESAAESRSRRVVQLLLRSGLACAFMLMVAGIVVQIVDGRREAPAVRLFHIGAARRGDALMALGVLVLAATPALRVVALLVLWARQRDRRFVAVALVVFAVLGAAIAIGHG
jgi:uncharacterized membrane protein